MQNSVGLGCHSVSLFVMILYMAKRISYWFNTKTRQVESGPKSLAMYRIGPFETAEDAARAEQIVASRGKEIMTDEAEDD